MFESEAIEFPFCENLPKREKSKLAKCWELLQSLSDATAKEGALIPVMLAAKCLDVSRTRVDQLVGDGRLKRVVVDGHVFITEATIIAFARAERVNGRPRKTPLTLRECISAGREMVNSKA